MCPFKYQRIHTLFAVIHDYHQQHGTDPTTDYQALREIIADRSIVTGKNRMRAMIHNMTALKERFPKYHAFLDWFYMTYRTYHPKPETQPLLSNESTEPVPEQTQTEPANNITSPMLEPDAQSVNIKDVYESIERTVQASNNATRRRRWWLLFLA